MTAPAQDGSAEVNGEITAYVQVLKVKVTWYDYERRAARYPTLIELGQFIGQSAQCLVTKRKNGRSFTSKDWYQIVKIN